MIRDVSWSALVFRVLVLVTGIGLPCATNAVDADRASSFRRVGVLLVAFSAESKEAHALREGLRDAGYVEGRNVAVEWRSANADYSRLPELVADLVQHQVEVIVVENTVAALAIRRVTSTIPIVLAIVADPMGSGLAASLSRPGGNATGLSMMLIELSGKRLQVLKEVLPPISRVAVLSNPAVPWHAKVIDNLKASAPALSIQLSFASARTPEEFGPAFSTFSRAGAQALYVIEDPLFLTNSTALFRMASNARLATVHGMREFVEAGGLMSYGVSGTDLFRRSAVYVDRILKGAKPGDLPIEQPTKFDLVLNLKTAKALGLEIPRSVLVQAAEVIR